MGRKLSYIPSTRLVAQKGGLALAFAIGCELNVHVAQATVGTPAITEQLSTDPLAETYAFATNTGVNGAGTWEMVTLSNTASNKLWGYLTWGCTNNNYSSWRTNLRFQAGNSWGDPTGGYSSVDGMTFATQVEQFWDTRKNGGAGGWGYEGLRLYWVANPCPASGTPSWSTTSWLLVPQNGGSPIVDHPAFVYDPVYNKKYIVYTESVPGLGGYWGLAVGMLNPDLSLSLWHDHTCSNAPASPLAPQATVDPGGSIHIVYLDQSNPPVIRHETFEANGNGFACQNALVGPYVWPGQNCTTNACTTCNNANPPVCTKEQSYGGIGNGCVRANPSVSIAIDSSGSGNTLIAYSSYNSGTGPCVGKPGSGTRLYYSSGADSSFTYYGETCGNFIFPRVAAASAPGAPKVAGLFHLATSVGVGTAGALNLQELDWSSSTGLANWNLRGWLSNPYAVPIPGQCYAGDYQGIASDMIHNKFFSSWGQAPSSGVPWVIEGNTDDK